MDKVIIIGGVAAGMSAASKYRRLNPKAVIEVFEKDSFVSYGACGIPYYISNVIEDYEKMIIRTPEMCKSEHNIKVKTGYEVFDIDPEKKIVKAIDVASQEESSSSYDNLVIATGASPLIPDLPGMKLGNVFTVRNLHDGIHIKEKIQKKRIKKVAIIGAGYIGLEMSEALKAMGKEVLVIEKMARPLLNFGEDISEIVVKELTEKDVDLKVKESLVELKGKRNVKEVVTDKDSYQVDAVILTLGVKPNSELAEKAGLKIGFKNAIEVDSYLRTSEANVFAAGDCAETFHRVLKKNIYVPLGTTANRQGRIVGENLAGAEKKYSGSLGTAVAKIFDLTVARTGITMNEAEREGFDVDVVFVKTQDHAPYYPGPRDLYIKIIFDRKKGKVLGAQMAGYQEVAKRIDVFATAIYNEMHLNDLTQVDFCYAPPYAMVWEANAVAANVALTKWEKEK